MQQIRWYVNRLRMMSAGEILWRIYSAIRDILDYLILDFRQKPMKLSELIAEKSLFTPGFRTSNIALSEWRDKDIGSDNPQARWYENLIGRADKIAQHKLSFFDLKDKFLGETIDWNKDYKSGKSAPMKFAPHIDYRDFNITGDCKFVWEPNRHHHLVVLARAYRASGEIRYAKEIINQLTSWFEQCPYGIGMNWRSPLELGVRLINWVWAVDLMYESNLIRDDFLHRLLDIVYKHLWEIVRKRSRCSSVNNHLIGEMAGVFVATAYFKEMKNAKRWHILSKEILEREIINQTYPDGCSREHALRYHIFVMQFFLIAGVVAKKIGDDFSDNYWSRLEKMFEFVSAIAQGGENLPMFGDYDDGYVLDLSYHPHDINGLLSAGAEIFQRDDLRISQSPSEWPIWLIDGATIDKSTNLPADNSTTLTSRAFTSSGYYLLQNGEREDTDCVSLLFDSGQQGLKPLVAHGHADALSFVLRVGGKDIFIDSGTYDYFSFPDWRNYFRSTRAHNTVEIDGENQAELAGPFLWNTQADATALEYQPTAAGGAIIGEHTGYFRLANPVLHRRTIKLNDKTITIIDNLEAIRQHKITQYFHLAENVRIDKIETNHIFLRADSIQIEMIIDERLDIRTYMGSENPIMGWSSRGYHRKTPITTIAAEYQTNGAITLNTTILIVYKS